jgi:hypothetical protein
MLKVKVALEQSLTGGRGIEVELYSFFGLGARWRWVVNATPRWLYPQKETRYLF